MVTNFKGTENLSLRENGWKIEYLYVKEIRGLKKDWIHPKFIVNWLLEADVHVCNLVPRDTLRYARTVVAIRLQK